jgi:hypothetical protein
MSLISRVNELLDLETNQVTSELQKLEKSWLDLIDDCEGSDWEILVLHNRFRLRNLPTLEIKRPNVLIGAVNDASFPNFHTIELLRIADVVSLTTQSEDEQTIERISYSLVNDSIDIVISKLPKGFKPVCYWDSQAEHGHPQPMGLANSPFPTIASICHVFHSPATKRLLEVFDYVLPLGAVFDEYLSASKSKVLRIPFGLNWASLEYLFNSEVAAKDIDVSVTFLETNHPPYGELRNQVVSKMEDIKSQWGQRFNIVIKGGLSKEEYLRLLQRSKISINAVGFHGPYNYRTCEIINAGALLFQTNVHSHGIESDPNELFEDGENYISFDVENLEEKLLDLLSDDERISRIAQSARKKLEKEFNYRNLYTELFQKLEAAENESSERLEKAAEPSVNQFGDFHLAAFLWEQTQKKGLRVIGAGLLSKMLPQFDDARFYSNLLAILPEVYENFGFPYLHTLIAERNKTFADSLPPNDMKQIVIQIYSLLPDHVAVVYNMISLSMENDWIDRQQLPSLANQGFSGKVWDQYDSSWLLRYPISPDGNGPQIKYDQFLIPLLLTKENPEVWAVYRDYLLYLANK